MSAPSEAQSNTPNLFEYLNVIIIHHTTQHIITSKQCWYENDKKESRTYERKYNFRNSITLYIYDKGTLVFEVEFNNNEKRCQWFNVKKSHVFIDNLYNEVERKFEIIKKYEAYKSGNLCYEKELQKSSDGSTNLIKKRYPHYENCLIDFFNSSSILDSINFRTHTAKKIYCEDSDDDYYDDDFGYIYSSTKRLECNQYSIGVCKMFIFNEMDVISILKKWHLTNLADGTNIGIWDKLSVVIFNFCKHIQILE